MFISGRQTAKSEEPSRQVHVCVCQEEDVPFPLCPVFSDTVRVPGAVKTSLSTVEQSLARAVGLYNVDFFEAFQSKYEQLLIFPIL